MIWFKAVIQIVTKYFINSISNMIWCMADRQSVTKFQSFHRT